MQTILIELENKTINNTSSKFIIISSIVIVVNYCNHLHVRSLICIYIHSIYCLHLILD